MYKLEIYVAGQRLDLFQDESIELVFSAQNISDISKVFGDFSQSFTIPASPVNNKVFKHYYNVDVFGGFNASTRVDAFIDVNGNLLRNGVIELEGVTLRNGEPYSYRISFFSKITALKDLFGEDELVDLDLSAYNHAYNDTNIKAGLDGFVSGTSDSVIYPLISPVRNWFFNSGGSNHDINNISYHAGHNEHGVFYYELKPAIKIKAILDAIATKYGISFNSTFFSSTDFGKLYMWGHRRAGWMFKGQPNGGTAQKIDFATQTGTDFDLTADEYVINSVDQIVGKVRYSITSTDSYRIEFYINGELFTYRNHSGSVSNVEVFFPDFEVGDRVQMRFAPPTDWDASTIQLTSLSASWFENPSGSYTINTTTAITSTQSYSAIVVMAEQMPEQKVSDFIGGLVRAFNLVLIPTGATSFDVEPLSDWYLEGNTIDVTKYIDISEVSVNKPSLYRRISYKYNETEAILGEEYRLQNDIGYGDLRADFSFDGGEFEVELPFDNMLFERLTDLDTNLLTTLGVGKSITRELEPYIGNPFMFYLAGTIRGVDEYAFIDMTNTVSNFTDFHLVSNVNNGTAETVTRTLNFGTEVDPYLLQGFSSGLYATYWSDYITDLYNPSRRVFTYKAHLPLGVMLNLRMNTNLIISNRKYIINKIKLNPLTGEAELELINDV